MARIKTIFSSYFRRRHTASPERYWLSSGTRLHALRLVVDPMILLTSTFTPVFPSPPLRSHTLPSLPQFSSSRLAGKECNSAWYLIPSAHALWFPVSATMASSLAIKNAGGLRSIPPPSQLARMPRMMPVLFPHSTSIFLTHKCFNLG